MTIVKIKHEDNNAWTQLIEGYDNYTHLFLFSFDTKSSSFYSTMRQVVLNNDCYSGIVLKQIEWSDFYWYFVSIPNLILGDVKSLIKEKKLTLLRDVRTITINDKETLKIEFPFAEQENVFMLGTESTVS